MHIGIIDLEATSLNTASANIIEFAALKVDTGSWEVVGKVDALIKEPRHDKITSETTKITGITQDMIDTRGVPLSQVIHHANILLGDVKCLVAHNKSYDEPLLINNLVTYGITPDIYKKPWICSAFDINHGTKNCRKLSHLALDYGVIVDISKLHRAADDCMLLVDMLKKRGVDFELDFEDFMAPKAMFRAHPRPPWEDGGEENKLVKQAGFRWDNEKKQWLAEFKIGHQFELTPFKIEELT